MYTIVITNLKENYVVELIEHTARTIMRTSDGCPLTSNCKGQDCPACIESHIHVLQDAD